MESPDASSRKRPRQARQQETGGRDPDPTRAVADRATDAGPEAVGGGLGAAVGGALGPEDPAAADHQQRRQQRHHHEHGDGDADGEDRAEPGGGVEVGERQAQHADGDGRRAGEDRRRGAVQRERHRLVAVLVTTELFPVAGDEQQRVVGAGSDHQDAEDGLALAVDREVGVLRQEVDQAGRDEVGRDGTEDREQPQDRAAVGEEQDHDDDGERGEDQVGVDALEGLGGVGGLAAVAGEVDLSAVERGDLTDLVSGVGDVVPAVGSEVEHEVEVGDLAVLGHQRRHRRPLGRGCLRGRRRQHALVGDAVDLGDLRAVGLDLRRGRPRSARRHAGRPPGWGCRWGRRSRTAPPGPGSTPPTRAATRRPRCSGRGELGREGGHDPGDAPGPRRGRSTWSRGRSGSQRSVGA